MGDEINQIIGVRQGCLLSSLLFVLYLEFGVRLANADTDKSDEIMKCLKDILAYVDDLAVSSVEEEELRERLDALGRGIKAEGMEISVRKTKVMVAAGKERRVSHSAVCTVCGSAEGYEDMMICSDEAGLRGCQRGFHASCMGLENIPDGSWFCADCVENCSHFRCEDGSFDIVDEFEYLGSVQSATVTSTGAIRHRIMKATKAYGMLSRLWKSRMSYCVKGLVYKTMVRTVLLHGATTWTTTKSDIRELEVFEMRCLRRMANTTLLAHRTSASVREQL